jgi:hypothetical protein
MPRIALVGEHGKMIGIEENHEWAGRFFVRRAAAR